MMEKAAATAQEGDFSFPFFAFISAEKTGSCYCEVCEAAWVAWKKKHIPPSLLPLTRVRHDEAAWCEGRGCFIWVEVAFSCLNHEKFPLASQIFLEKVVVIRGAAAFAVTFFLMTTEKIFRLRSPAPSTKKKNNKKLKCESEGKTMSRRWRNAMRFLFRENFLEVAKFMTTKLEKFQVDFLFHLKNNNCENEGGHGLV